MKKKRIRKPVFGRVFWQDATLSFDKNVDSDSEPEDRMFIKENYGIISFDNPKVLTITSEYDHQPGEERKRVANTVLDIPRQWAQYVEQHISGNKWRKLKI